MGTGTVRYLNPFATHPRSAGFRDPCRPAARQRSSVARSAIVCCRRWRDVPSARSGRRCARPLATRSRCSSATDDRSNTRWCAANCSPVSPSACTKSTATALAGQPELAGRPEHTSGGRCSPITRAWRASNGRSRRLHTSRSRSTQREPSLTPPATLSAPFELCTSLTRRRSPRRTNPPGLPLHATARNGNSSPARAIARPSPRGAHRQCRRSRATGRCPGTAQPPSLGRRQPTRKLKCRPAGRRTGADVPPSELGAMSRTE